MDELLVNNFDFDGLDSFTYARVMETLEHFVDTINDIPKSSNLYAWDLCYSEFGSINLENITEENIIYLSQSLFAYLSAYGLTRVQEFKASNYMALIPAVRLIVSKKYYTKLRGISIEKLCENENFELFQELVNKISFALTFNSKVLVSKTYLAKILMGTLGCSVGYDKNVITTLQRSENLIATPLSKSSAESIRDFYKNNYNVLESARNKIETHSQKTYPYPEFKLFDLLCHSIGKSLTDKSDNVSFPERDWERCINLITREMNVNSKTMEDFANNYEDTCELVSRSRDIYSPIEEYIARDPNCPPTIYAVCVAFVEKVMTGHVWDHKVILPQLLSNDSWFSAPNKDDKSFWVKVPRSKHYINYDVWSNIHYGYVGRRAGLPISTLDFQRYFEGQDDAGDRLSVQIGYELFDNFPNGISSSEFSDYLLKNIYRYEGIEQYVSFEDPKW